MDKDYNKILLEAIKLWIDRAEDEFEKHLRKSISYKLIQDIFKQIDESINAEFYLGKFDWETKMTGNGAKHFLYYFMWTIKWFLYKQILKSKKIIVTQLLPDTDSTKRYLKELANYQNQNDCVLINIGMIYSFKKIFTKSIFCFPIKLYGHKYLDKKKNISSELKKDLHELEEILKVNFSEINLKVDDFEFIYLANIKVYLAVKFFVDSYKAKIKFLLQDIDYLAERVLINYLIKKDEIKTICIDHSLRIYDHLHNYYPSDIYFFWGEFNKSKFIKSNAETSKECHLIGLDRNRFSNIQNTDVKYWIFFLQSYGNPHSPTFNRPLPYSLKVLQNVIDTAKVNGDVELIIKSHPSDKYIFKNLFPNNYISEVDNSILEKTELLFVEDSTISAELLNTNIPIIYVEDMKNSNPMGLADVSNIQTYKMNKNLGEIVSYAFETEINATKRNSAYKYYFGESKSISQILNKIFE